MDIRTIGLDEIKEAPYNPRHISDTEFQTLINSIDEFGLADPIIINLKKRPQ